MKFLLFFTALLLLASCNQSTSVQTQKKAPKTAVTSQQVLSEEPSLTADKSKINVPHEVSSYVKDYCIKCHNEEKDKGDRRFDNLSHDFNDPDVLVHWEEILEQLNLGEMPPEKKGVKQPSQEENRYMVSWITETLHSIESDKLDNKTVLRRLNREEYLNTLADLLKVNIDSFDPTELFPQDNKEEGFDTIGAVQVLSDYQLQKYLEAAEKFIDKAVYFGAKPKAQKWEFSARDFSGRGIYPRAQVSWSLKKENFVEHGHGRPIARYPCYPVRFGRKGVPADGVYRIKIQAEAVNRLDHPYKTKDIPIDLTKKMKMGLLSAHNFQALTKNAVEQRTLIDVFELEDEKAQWYEATAYLTKGSTPFVHWMNGSDKTKGFIRQVGMKYHKEVMDNSKRDEGTYLGKDKGKIIGKALSDVYRGPVMRFYKITYEGPINKDWPPASHKALFGNAASPDEVNIKQCLTNLMTKAFRRPVQGSEVKPYSDFVAAKMKQGETKLKALKQGLKAVLVSPKFLYIPEGKEGALDNHQLASRLSYFLWSSAPDQQLMEIAARGELTKPDVLKKQVLRMLNDDRSANFSKRFTDSWLRLNTLGMNPPDEGKFKIYYSNRLESAMRQETVRFFDSILKENKSAVELLAADWTYVNDVLADHYGLKGVKGNHFRKVSLPESSRRGGLLGHASILTLTSNGVETSPVIRGIWILENILGTPPSPPPPDVEPLEPDVRGTKTIREQLDKHRQVEACNDCHRKIDPLGFALEYYDPIGRFRADYGGRGKKKRSINGSGELPSGEKFSNEVSLKQILLKKKEMFIHTVTDKMLIYATGRKMTFKDKKEIDRIVSEVHEKNNSLKEIVIQVALSDIFRKK